MRRFLLVGLLLSGFHAPPAVADAGAASATLQAIMNDVRASNWAAATKLAAGERDRLVAKLVTFYRLLDPGQASTAEIAAFQRQNPDWPEQDLLRRRWDEALAADPNDNAVRHDCLRRVPTTPAASARCASAYAGKPGGTAARFARRAWATGFEQSDAAAAFLAEFGPLLNAESYWQRFQNLAIAGDVNAAQAILSALPPSEIPVASAWIALARRAADASTIIAGLSMHQRRAPLLFLARVSAAPDPQSSLALWLADGRAAAERAGRSLRPLFWPRADALARELLSTHDPKGAYSLITAIPADGAIQDSERDFLTGFIALRFLHEPKLAAPRFAALTAGYRAVITRSRGYYWLAQTESGKLRKADLKLAAAFPDTFYGQLAASAIGITSTELGARIRNAARVPIQPVAVLHFAERQLPQAAFLLTKMGAPRRARAFLFRAAEIAPDIQDRALAALMARNLGQLSTEVMIARLAGIDGEMLIRLGWPVPVNLFPRNPTGSASRRAVILSIVRQESSFDPDAVSNSGAVGLMQLLPATARYVAQKQGLVFASDGLRKPAENIALGSDYFEALMQRFGYSIPLAVAAYNAGPRNVEAWLATNGDPRMPPAAGGVDMVNWIEEIPFQETRNYTERVIEGIVIYRALLDQPAGDPLRRWVTAR